MKIIVRFLVTCCVLTGFLSAEGVSPDVKVKEVKTPKGLVVWAAEMHHSEVISISLIIRDAGDKSDPKGKVGRAKLAIATMKEGCGQDNAHSFKKKVLKENLKYTIHADDDEVRFHARFPSKNLKSVVGLMTAYFNDSKDDAEAVNRIKNKMMIGAKQSLQDEGTLAEIATNKLIYHGHPYGRTVEDVIQDLPSITAEDFKKYRQERFAKDKVEFVIVGDFKEDEILPLLDAWVEKFQDKATDLDVKDAQLQNLGQERFVELDVPQTMIIFLQPGIKRNHKDFLTASLLNRIVGGGAFRSRLWDEVRDKNGLVYHIETDLRLANHSEFIFGEAGTKGASTKDVMTRVRHIWQTVHKEGVTQKELDFAKENITGTFINSFDSTAGICTILANFRYHGLPADYINKRNEMIAKVTLEDINRVAKELIAPDKLTFIVVGRKESWS